MIEEKIISVHENGDTVKTLSNKTGEAENVIRKCLLEHGIFEDKNGVLVILTFGGTNDI